MLKKVILKNWKSFREASLPIDPLTILIGTNASGKSNALDALEFLYRVTMGKEIQAALAGDSTLNPLRGGIEWATLKPESQFTLEVIIQGKDIKTDYHYSITVETQPRIQLFSEYLIKKTKKNTVSLFKTEDNLTRDSPSITTRLYNSKSGTTQGFYRTHSLLHQLKGSATKEEIFKGVTWVSQILQNIFILDPIPSQMRSYSSLSDRVQNDAANLAGVLAALPDNQKAEIEEKLAFYGKNLPERDITKVWSETVGRFNNDAMLYCEELWNKNEEPRIIDAKAMSDGTLRFLAILTALLTRPQGSQMVIEEVDNNLHPSRSHLLVKMLREIGEQRQVDLLVTTHNPALLDAFGPEVVPFVIVAHRDFLTGESLLTPLEEIENLPKLMASGSLGKLTTQGVIEKNLMVLDN